MRVLIACEYSGLVRDAFRRLGHDAWSCDFLKSERSNRYHIRGDVKGVLGDRWDMLIGFPTCTYLCVSGARWWPTREREQKAAIAFVKLLWGAPIKRVVIENPIGRLSTAWRKPTQIIQPWQYGHGETKATCLWIRGVKPLRPTEIVEGREARIHRMPASLNRAKERSRTYSGVANAMGIQWGIKDFY